MSTFLEKKQFSSLFAVLFLATSLLLSGCASNRLSEADIEVSEADPFEGLNRNIFGFNEGVDEYVAQPVSDAYLWVTPQIVQTGIANFFNNLKDINVVLNDVMQGKLKQGAADSGRFLLNSTAGLAGLFDVATEVGLEKHEEDFAQTLAVWGLPQGPYLVLPVLGPTTGRGVPGAIFDTAANPASYVGFPVQLIQLLNARANAEGALNFIDEAALDPYIFTRESFLQHRKYLATDGNSEITDDVLSFEDDFYDEDDELSDEAESSGVAAEVNAAIEQEEVTAMPQMAKTSMQDQEQESSAYKLRLSSDVENYGQASESFDGAVKSFDQASRSFEQAGKKIEKLD